ncbi:unnamed protein product [Brachionus calyciflorus]|uniref:Anion exchange protein n=1 Tax=Brachionus calyciflorus TaxID=104777 RepID=A0A813WI93_9BILA|nr:unnamed protein product [Brachionus calyciflorus]
MVSNQTDLVKFSIEDNEMDAEYTPRHLFCEMDELFENSEWRESARWLKFEEEVENGGRWSKPHVATLSLHSLFELRSCLLNGATLLDFPGEDLPNIVDGIMDSVIRLHLLSEDHRENVRNVLLLKHVHQHEKEFQRQISNGEKRPFPLIKSLADLGKRASHIDMKDLGSLSHVPSSSLLAANASSLNLKQSPTQPIFELTGSQTRISKTDSKAKMNQNFMRKIPTGAEASNVLVGEVDFLEHQFTVFVRLAKSVILGDLTEVPVPTRFLFIILGPKGNLPRYHEIGRSVSTLMSDEIFHEVAYKAKNKHDILNAFDVFLDQVTVLPPGEWDPNIRLDPPNKLPLKEERLERLAESTKLNGSLTTVLKKEEEPHSHEFDPGLTFTGRFCGGLIDDCKRKLPWFLSDFKDGLNFQCLSSILFMYFACLSPIITFGGLLGTATDQNMSAIESLLSGAICGILYSLFSGQPMTILGSTGPVLVFETILNQFSKDNGIDYMGFRAWIGLWTCLILVIIVVTDCSALVKYITRFTEESFASLIAFIFIKESISKLIEIHKTYEYSNDPNKYVNDYLNNSNCSRCVHLGNQTIAGNFLNQKECENLGSAYQFRKDCKYSPDVFFVSVFLYIFTFLLAMTIRAFRTSRFFPSSIRSKVSDFGVVITIISAVALDSYLGFDTPKLIVPLKFETTIPTRGWFINPIERNKDKIWLAFAAVIPALLATILVFMDQHITAVIVNRKENKLKKSSGYHLDLLIVAIAIGINSLIGIPWFVAATVLSINHVLSLKKESEASAPGEKPKFLGVIEQRLTGTVVFMLIGSSVFLSTLLRKIPMPVLYGIFLYMGISSLNGIQFMQRLILFFMPEKHQPDYIFLRHVRTFKVHIFTIIQISCLAMLFIIKMNKTISILFPIMVLALVGIRKLMDYIFTQKELSYLDDIMPEIVKRSKEDGKDVGELESQEGKTHIKTDSINISTELSKTHIWQELVNSDKQLSNERDSLVYRKKKHSDSKPIYRKHDLTASPVIDEDANVPLVEKNLTISQNSIPTIVIEPSNTSKNQNNSTKL